MDNSCQREFPLEFSGLGIPSRWMGKWYRAVIEIQDGNETWPIGYLIDRISVVRRNFSPV